MNVHRLGLNPEVRSRRTKYFSQLKTDRIRLLTASQIMYSHLQNKLSSETGHSDWLRGVFSKLCESNVLYNARANS